MKKKELLDKQLLAEIQPQGGITFSDEAYIRTGVGYEAVSMCTIIRIRSCRNYGSCS